MKVKKVIFACDLDYLNYFTHVKEFYNTYLNIDVILLLFSANNNKIMSDDRNTVIHFKKNVKKYLIPWSLFYGASLFPEDTIMTSGIDQIPLSNIFFNKLKSINEDKLVVGISDCYNGYKKDTLGYYNTLTNVLYPSSHIVGKGKIFKEIFNIQSNIEKEFLKIDNFKDKFYFNNWRYKEELYWGIDECYMSYMISIFKDKEKIHHILDSRNWFLKNRIECLSEFNKKNPVELSLKPSSLLNFPNSKNLIRLYGEKILNDS